MSTPDAPSPGWYPDPNQPGGQRWWTGVAWSATTKGGAPVAPPPPQYPGAGPAASPAQTPAYQVAPPAYQPAGGYASPAQAPGGQAWQPQYGAGQGYAGYADLVPPGAPRGFGEAISTVFRNYAAFGGRASRSEFWYWTLFYVLVMVVGYALAIIPLATNGSSLEWFGVLVVLLLGAFGLAIIVPTIALTVRRLRDAGLPWPLIFLQLVPYIGGIVILILCAQRAKPWPLPRV